MSLWVSIPLVYFIVWIVAYPIVLAVASVVQGEKEKLFDFDGDDAFGLFWMCLFWPLLLPALIIVSTVWCIYTGLQWALFELLKPRKNVKEK